MERSVRIVQLLPIIVLLLTFSSISHSQTVSNELLDQGIMTNSSGATLGEQTLAVTFQIYNKETGGTSIWSEPQQVTIGAGMSII